MTDKKKHREVHIENRRARYDYEFLETYVAGLVLMGPEVKAIRAGHVSIADAFCWFAQYELWSNNLNIIIEGAQNSIKVLLTKKELKKLDKNLHDGLTIVIKKLFTQNGRIKAEIALARGKKNYDKRQTIKERDIQRELNRKQ
jgi:SsrA-binding protein